MCVYIFLLLDYNALVVDPAIQTNSLDFILHLLDDIQQYKGSHTFGILCENG